MSAPNLPALFDFEGQFETAGQGIMAGLGITAYISQQNVKEELVSTGIGFDLGPATGDMTQIPKPTLWPADQAAPQEYFRYTGNLEFRVQVPRDGETPTIADLDNLMGQFRGQIRSAMMLCVMPFTDANLPWLRVSDIRPNGTSTGWDRDLNTDYCALRFTITFAIQPTAWPAWIES